MVDPVLANYNKYPRMAHWFSPWLLARLLNNVFLSSVFGQYADRRLMIAALDTVDAQTHVERAQKIKLQLTPGQDEAVWIDWVADLGDGFDSTYAVATLIAKDELTVDGVKLPRAQALFMGGDQVYPAATAQAYQNQLRQPYAWAFPDHDKKSDDGVPVYAIPGNHDWYDGLVLFLAFFCNEKPWHLGNWRAHQRRSYFAVQITDNWWIWATDIQLQDDMDAPQASYFQTIAKAMPKGSKIILCSAEPGWLYTHTNSQSWEIMDYAIKIATDADRDLTIPVLLSGDTHHYSRYSAKNGKQFITSGGGGAFLHPTHQLRDEVTLKWRGQKTDLSLKKKPDEGHGDTDEHACYPSKPDSAMMLWRNLLFAFKNWDFSILMGFIYTLVGAAVTLRDQWDTYIIVALLVTGAIVRYSVVQEKSKRPVVLITSTLHAIAHILTMITAALHFASYNAQHFNLVGEWYSGWKWAGILLAEMGAVGFFVGSTIFGLYLLITCGFFRLNYNDAFSAFRLGGYNNFLRLKFTRDGGLEIYAIGLRNVPKRNQWIPNPKAQRGNPNESTFSPKVPLSPHIIEKIHIL